MPRLLHALLYVVIAGAPATLLGQGDPIAAGQRAMADHDFAAAQHDFESALRHDPNSYEANWRLALALIEVAKQIPDHVKSPLRDSLYREAESYARRAVAVKPQDAQGHFALADAIGRAILSMSPREKVRRAIEVRDEAMRAVELDPKHDGAWHVLGRWNAEVQRLPGIEKFFARTFLGGAVFKSASWQEAERDLRLAIRYAPSTIVHHFDLAEILMWQGKNAAALAELGQVAALPSVDISDPSYKEQARTLELKLKGKHEL